jgi:Amt family ammonium transporter
MTILVVEDHQPTAHLLGRVLHRAGHRAVLCASAEEAEVRLTEDGIGTYEICVIDLTLPGRDGISLCRWIRTQPGGDLIYLIVGTGSDFTRKLGEALDAGADDYVEKPYDNRLLELRFAVAAGRIAAAAEQLRLESALESERHLVGAVFNAAAASIVALGPDGTIAKINRAASDLTGLPEMVATGHRFRDLFSDERGRDEGIAARLSDLIAGAEPVCEFETQVATADNSCRDLAWVCRRSEPDAESGTGPLVVCVGTDITERRRLESQLAFLAERDPLTHLLNRSQLDAAVQRVLDAAAEGRPAALLSIDLDDFKIVNDTAGHAAGDSLLQAVAHVITRHTRPTDTVIRLGGDEFVIVLPDATADQAGNVAERIRAAVDRMGFAFGGRPFHITVSIGLLEVRAGMALEDALARVDAACYASKRAGRNLVTAASVRDGEERTEDHHWHGRLQSAIAHDTIDLWLQPIVCLESGETMFHEVLLRLPGDAGASTPSQFLPTARRLNLLPELDRCVIKNSLDLLQFDPQLRLSVNLSGRSASDPRLPEFLIAAVGRSGVDPARVIFEITESELIPDLPQAIERLTRLRSQGFRFALDDFGRGYSSFSYLRDLPVEMVKIDGSYTQALADDSASAAFIGAITDLAHAIGLRCVAEHVEHPSVIEPLRRLGVDFGQGYHLGEPKSYLTHAPRGGEERRRPAFLRAARSEGVALAK